MKKRIITVIVTYDLEDEELKDASLAPAKYVEEMTKREMEDHFCWSEGFEKVEVNCKDVEV